MKRTNGKSTTKIYQTWLNMKQRCYNPKSPEYKRYGARGIKVDPAWHSFEAFYLCVGVAPPGRSLDKINNDKDYGPSNWKWSTPKEQAKNRRNNIFLTFNGETLHLSAWSRKLKIHPATLAHRVKIGMKVDEILSLSKFNRLQPAVAAEIKRLLKAKIPYRVIAKTIGVGVGAVLRLSKSFDAGYLGQQDTQS